MQNNKHSPCPYGKGTGRRTFRVQRVVRRTLPGQQDSPGGHREETIAYSIILIALACFKISIQLKNRTFRILVEIFADILF